MIVCIKILHNSNENYLIIMKSCKESQPHIKMYVSQLSVAVTKDLSKTTERRKRLFGPLVSENPVHGKLASLLLDLYVAETPWQKDATQEMC